MRYIFVEAYKVLFGNELVTQCEFSALYSVAVDNAIARKNLKTGFAKVHLFPLMSGDAWLASMGLSVEFDFLCQKVSHI